MEAVCSSEMSVNFDRTTLRHIHEDSTSKGMHNKSVYLIKQITFSRVKDSVSKVKPAGLVLRFGCDMNNEMELPLKYFKTI
jgi:hypothetical protein